MMKPVRRKQLLDCLRRVMGIAEEPSETGEHIVTRHSLTEERKQRIRILLAEDNPTNQIVALSLLAKFGYKADIASSGIEALNALSRTDYDLVFMDIQMPEMDGITAAREIRKRPESIKNPDLPIIAMTAHALKSDREKCLEAGMSDYISKPIQAAELSAILDKWLNSILSAEDDTEKIPDTEENMVQEHEQIRESAPAFDREGVLMRLGNDEEILDIILDTFVKDAPRIIRSLEEAIPTGDLTLIHRLAHTLKGAASNAGAEALRESSFIMEQDADNGDLHTAQELIKQINADYAAFHRAIIK